MCSQWMIFFISTNKTNFENGTRLLGNLRLSRNSLILETRTRTQALVLPKNSYRVSKKVIVRFINCLESKKIVHRSSLFRFDLARSGYSGQFCPFRYFPFFTDREGAGSR